MCISAARAAFTGTTVYAGGLDHPDHGLIHVLAYQNTAVNLADGANAMLLHLPAAEPVAPTNFLDVGERGDFLKRMVDAVRPVPVGIVSRSKPRSAPAVTVFEHDVYTVLLAADPHHIPDALERIPERRRPVLRPELFAFYAERFPAHTIALCCFDNADAARAKPLTLWYRPTDPDLLVAPALDAHTGAPPRPGEPVAVDHWVLFGADGLHPDRESPVTYPPDLPPVLRSYLPAAVVGRYFGGTMPNGDFAIDLADLRGADPVARIRRLQPTR